MMINTDNAVADQEIVVQQPNRKSVEITYLIESDKGSLMQENKGLNSEKMNFELPLFCR
jgi:hypothetical protein